MGKDEGNLFCEKRESIKDEVFRMSMEFKMTGLAGFVEEREVAYLDPMIQAVNDLLLSHTGAGNDFHGWVDLPVDYDK